VSADWFEPYIESARRSVEVPCSAAAEWLGRSRDDGMMLADALLGHRPAAPAVLDERVTSLLSLPSLRAYVIAEWLPNGSSRSAVLVGDELQVAAWLVVDDRLFVGEPFGFGDMWGRWSSVAEPGLPIEVPRSWFAALCCWRDQSEWTRTVYESRLADVLEAPGDVLDALIDAEVVVAQGDRMVLGDVGKAVHNSTYGSIVKVLTITVDLSGPTTTELLLSGPDRQRRCAVLRGGSPNTVVSMPTTADDVMSMLSLLSSTSE